MFINVCYLFLWHKLNNASFVCVYLLKYFLIVIKNCKNYLEWTGPLMNLKIYIVNQ